MRIVAKQGRKAPTVSEYAYRVDLVRAVYTIPLDKYGHVIDGAAPTWVLLTDSDQAMYRYLARRGYKGAAYPSLRRIARDRHISESTVIRSLRRLRNLGLITWQNRRTEAGDFTSNLYSLYPPDQPCGPLAVLVQDQIRRLHPTAEIPAFEHRTAVRSIRPDGPRRSPSLIAPLVVPPAWARQIAQSEGVAHDLRLVSEAWARLIARSRVKGKPVRSPGALFRHLLRILPAELELNVRRHDPDTSSPARGEQIRRQAWIWSETLRLLSQGEPVEAIPDLLLRSPALQNLTIWSSCSAHEITVQVSHVADEWQAQHDAAESLPAERRQELEQELAHLLARGYSPERAASFVFASTTDVQHNQVLMLATSLAVTRPA